MQGRSVPIDYSSLSGLNLRRNPHFSSFCCSPKLGKPKIDVVSRLEQLSKCCCDDPCLQWGEGEAKESDSTQCCVLRTTDDWQVLQEFQSKFLDNDGKEEEKGGELTLKEGLLQCSFD